MNATGESNGNGNNDNDGEDQLGLNQPDEQPQPCYKQPWVWSAIGAVGKIIVGLIGVIKNKQNQKKTAAEMDLGPSF